MDPENSALVDSVEANVFADSNDSAFNEFLDSASHFNRVSTANNNEDVESGSSNSSKKGRVRRRKKELYRKIRDQIAYYFSDSNLRHDKFMRKLTGADVDCDKTANNGDEKADDPLNCNNYHDHLSGTKSVPLSVFLKFNKITELAKSKEDLFKAFQYDQEWTAFNTVLVFDPKHRTISRREPYFNSNGESNQRVIYVERFDVNIENIFEYLKGKFEQFGNILSIRTPRFRNSKQLMGFAFIEFSEKSSAEQAIQYFDKLGPEQPTNGAAQAEPRDFKSDLKQGIEEESFAVNNTVPTSDHVQTKKMKLALSQLEFSRDTQLNEPDKAKNPPDQVFLRVMSKQRWNQYKNRYLKLQKSANSVMFKLPIFDRNLCQTIQDSFDVSSLKFAWNQHNRGEVPLPNSGYQCQQSSSTHFGRVNAAATDAPLERVNLSSIVRLDLLTKSAQAIDSAKIRKSLRFIFDQQSKVESSSLPGSSEIAYIDVSDKRIDFLPDGSLKLTIFIRTHQLESANKLTGEDFRTQLAALLGTDVSVKKVAVLQQNEVNSYWDVINQSKQRSGRFK